ncbi:MAG: hydrogenase iron-sulfur subunit [Myxococcota bacterium]|nr:hydrogenase iron-sulfur subunit [Myxococcota bacterium]
MSDVKVLTFVCNWCSYGGADKAGGLKLAYPPGVRLVRVMCSGRVDPQMVVKAFREGADGVLVLGCHPGDCHYKDGNYAAQNRAAVLASMLGQFGIEKERFRLDWVSAGEGERFSRVVSDMYNAVAALGPLELHAHTPREMAS